MRKQMRRRARLLAAGVVALSLVAAACGDDDDDEAGSDATEAASATEAPSLTEAPPVTDAAPATEAPAATAAPAGTEAPGATTDGTESADTTEGATAGTAGGEVVTADALLGALQAPEDCESPEPISLRLQWAFQAQFAGYMAARELGFYEAMCLDVELIETGVDIVPQEDLANGAVDFAIAWVPKALQTREQGADIVNIAQVFQRSGTLQVSFADQGITSVADFAGKNIGNWGFGNEYEIFAALGAEGLDPAADVTLVQQDFNMDGLLAGDIDAAEAMTYNEYAQVLEAVNPDTGELYQPEDLNVISYEEVGVGMLQDALWADAAKLESDDAYRDQATRLVAASIAGWVFCRDNPEECRDIVVEGGSQLGASHQLWQMNEVNRLIWPSPDGIGMMDEEKWDQTIEIAVNTPNLEGATVLTAEPTEGAYTTDIVTAAMDLIDDSVDVTGEAFEPIEVTLEEGGA